MDARTQGPATIDFFVSYSPADERWAEWIAWTLEGAGYRTMMQKWDFVAGSNFIDFMDRGLRQAAAVIAVLSPKYLESTYGRLEWQAALRSSPLDPDRRLIPVRIEPCELTGLLATVTFLDLLGVGDEQVARVQLLGRVRDALDGRAATAQDRPAYPATPGAAATRRQTPATASVSSAPTRHKPLAAPGYPPTARTDSARDAVTLLHMPGPRFGRGLVGPGEPSDAQQWQARVVTWVTRATAAGAPEPDALLIAGNLTDTGSPRQVDEALGFIAGVRSQLGLEPTQVALVPGAHDVNTAACSAYFDDCRADERIPQAPYWPKWRHFTRLFHTVYQGLDALVFDADQAWTLFELPDLRLVIAGFNSTLAMSHRPDDRYGLIGDVQAAYFARALRPYERDGWLRVGLVAHDPSRRSAPAGTGDALRDADVFTRLLGGINLVAHGVAAPDDELGSLPGQVPLVPPAGPSAVQLLELTGSGVTRWSDDRAGRPRSRGYEAAWQSAYSTFRSPSAETDTQPRIEPPEAPAATDTLLDRVAEVCHVRFERAQVRRIGGAGAHLRVTHMDSGYVRTLLIGVVSGDDPIGQLERLVGLVHMAAPDDPMEVVHDSADGEVVDRLRAAASRTRVRLRSLVDFQGLPDLGEFITRQTRRLTDHPAYSTGQYVPQRYRSLVGGEGAIQPGMVDELMDLVQQDDGRFILLLGDFGRGKTFALRELTRRLTETPGAPLPVLIDLRALDRAHTVDGLVAAHLANVGNTVIDLRAFRYLLRQGRIALIFDGFDELVSRISYPRAADHLELLIQAAQDNAKIIVASRTQHFRNSAQVLTALGERIGLLPQRRVLQLEDFDSEQILAYLTRAYGDRSAAEQRYQLFEQISNLNELAANPRMLAFLARIEPERLATLVSSRQALSAADLYQEIIDYWLGYESQRTSQIAGAIPGLRPRELLTAVTGLAVRLWERGEVYLRPADMSEVAGTLTDLVVAMTAEETEHAIGSGSLLTRTDEGLFGFIHYSVCEWLVARHIADRLEADDDRLLRARTLSALATDFLCTLAPARRLDTWVRKVSAERPEGITPSTENALTIGSRLSIEVTSDLSGADLAGTDLSFRKFRQVNLSGANLSKARLVGADLTGANLSHADLTGARLDRADLTGADLTGADLTRAQLLGTRLARAKVSGSRWAMAALVGTGSEDPAAAELRGAAVSPPMPVQLGLAPAEVGVPYGFEIGRIPNPVSYHPQGTTLIFGSADGGLLVCDAATGQPVRTVAGHRSRIYCVRHSHDGRLLLTGSADGTARLWDAQTLSELHVLRDHEQWVWPVEVAPSGRVVATGDATGVLRIWDTATGELVNTLATNTSRIWSVAFHPNRPGVATGEEDGTVRIWNALTGEIRFQFRTDAGAAYRVRFSPDGDHLASAHHDGSVFEHVIADGAEPRTLDLGSTGRPVYCLRYHPDSRQLACGDTGGTVRLWTLAQQRAAHTGGPGIQERNQDADGKTLTRPDSTGTRRQWSSRVWTKHSGAVYGLDFSSDGKHLASADSDGAVRLGDSGGGGVRHELLAHRSSVWPMAFRRDGTVLATSAADDTHRVWDTTTGALVTTVRGHGRRLSLARFDKEGNRIATSSSDGVVREWDAHTGKLLHHYELPGRQLVSGFYSPEGSVLAGWDNGGVVHIWNAVTREYERQIITDTDHLWTAKFSPDGDVLATAEDDDSVRLRYRTTGRVIGELIAHRGRVRTIAFSPDERWLATGADDRTVRVWSLTDHRCVAVLRGHEDRVYSVAFTPDSTLLASAANDGKALIWDLRPLTASDGPRPDEPTVVTEPQTVLRRGSGRLWSVAISPDGTLLATAGDDLAVRLWNTHTGTRVQTLLGHTRRVWSVDFSPDGSLLVSSGDDGTAVVWDLTPLAQGEQPVIRMTLIGMSGGWVTATPDGRYKLEGEVGAEVWHVIGNSRFPLGALGQYLPHVSKVDVDADLTP